MRNFYFYKNKTIYCSFIGIIILQLICVYFIKYCFQPSWSMMILMYWIIVSPKQVNIGTGFFLGLITDVIFYSILGIHALSFSVISYIIIRKLYFFQNTSILQQSFFVTFFSLIDQSLKLLIIFLITKILHSPEILWNCIFNGIIWPFLIFVMSKIYLRQ